MARTTTVDLLYLKDAFEVQVRREGRKPSEVIRDAVAFYLEHNKDSTHIALDDPVSVAVKETLIESDEGQRLIITDFAEAGTPLQVVSVLDTMYWRGWVIRTPHDAWILSPSGRAVIS